MACANCEGLTGFWCPICSPKDYPRGPLDKVAELEADNARLRVSIDRATDTLAQTSERAIAAEAENARLRAELDAAKGRLASIASVLSARGCECGCDHGRHEHDDECARCYGCEIDAILNCKETTHGD